MSGVGYAFSMWREPFADIIDSVGDLPADVIEQAHRGREKLIAAAEKAEAERDWEAAISYLGRNRAPHALDFWWSDLSLDEKRQLVGGVWEMDEWPVTALGENRWLSMFKEVGFVSDGPPQPTDDLTVWRGAPVQSKGRGMSWTVDRAIAQRFADRWERGEIPSVVYVATIPPRAILAMVSFAEDSRGESEVVVNPRMLQGRIRIG